MSVKAKNRSQETWGCLYLVWYILGHRQTKVWSSNLSVLNSFIIFFSFQFVQIIGRYTLVFTYHSNRSGLEETNIAAKINQEEMTLKTKHQTGQLVREYKHTPSSNGLRYNTLSYVSIEKRSKPDATSNKTGLHGCTKITFYKLRPFHAIIYLTWHIRSVLHNFLVSNIMRETLTD